MVTVLPICQTVRIVRSYTRRDIFDPTIAPPMEIPPETAKMTLIQTWFMPHCWRQ